MENINYPSYSYPDSGDSSPRSREIDFENPPPSWEDSTAVAGNYKVKFMVSYNGQIQPRSHDNLLSYVAGDTKILAVDRNARFSFIHAKLASLVDANNESPSSVAAFTFKYQLPGEDLDALISVTNEDDLEHMMQEYDRMCRASSKPARLRLFIFPDHKVSSSPFSSTSSDFGKVLDRGPDRFVEALNSGPVHHQDVVADHNVVPDPAPGPVVIAPPTIPLPVQLPPPQQPPVNVSGNNVDYLFGLDKVLVHAPVQAQDHPVKIHEPVGQSEMLHELNRLQISAAQELHRQQIIQQQQQQAGAQELHHQQIIQQQQKQLAAAAAMYRPKSEENLAGNYADQYQNLPPQANMPANMQIPTGYWQHVEQQQNHQPPQQQPQQQQPPQYHQQLPQPHLQHQQQQPVYMMHVPPPQPNMYHAPVIRPVAANQGYFQVQRMPTEPLYREQQQQQPVYRTPVSTAAVNTTVQLRPVESVGYTQVAYDGTIGRQVYYTTAPPQGGAVPAPYQGVAGAAVVGSDMGSSGDGNVGPKIVPSSGGV